MSVSITERAATQIKKQMQKRGKGVGLRLGVKKAGCSGYTYAMDFADECSDQDVVFERFGVKVVVNSADLDYLNGVELDYAKEGINEAFHFNNPNVKNTCGCGESFSV